MEYVEVARASSERGEVVLRRRIHTDVPPGSPSVLELRVNGVFVMDSVQTSSEVTLARTALAMVERPRQVLVGGLGLGFTAHEVLADHRVQHVLVAEMEESLVRWFRDGTIPYGPAYLADSRLAVSVADVGMVVAEAAPGTFDVILLDVDNGPDFLVHPQNAWLYEQEFLGLALRAMRPGGLLGVWSSKESQHLAAAMRAVFGAAETRTCPVVLQGNEDTYWLHSARHQGDATSPAGQPSLLNPTLDHFDNPTEGDAR